MFRNIDFIKYRYRVLNLGGLDGDNQRILWRNTINVGGIDASTVVEELWIDGCSIYRNYGTTIEVKDRWISPFLFASFDLDMSEMAIAIFYQKGWEPCPTPQRQHLLN